MKEGALESHEVFQPTEDGVNFRTLSWTRALVLFVKINFAVSILSVPGSLGTLGAVGGALSLVGWEALNTYTALLIGDFRNNHPECHTLADMGGIVWGPIGKEVVGIMILIAQILYSAGGVVSIDTGLNALSDHSQCTVVFALIASIMVTVFSSVRTFSRLGWLTWVSFTTMFIAVFIFVVAVTRQDRPAAAPQTGPYELGYYNIAYPTFAAGMTATANIFLCGSGASMYPSIIAEMRRPQDFRKAVFINGLIVGALYLTFSLVIYRWCGQWIATPAFGSAGTLIKKISYGIAMPGMVIGNGIYQHVAAKYVFVRVLRNTKHLQNGTVIHWGTWIGVNAILGALIFVISQAVPILNYLLALAGSLFSAPFCLILPVAFWWHDQRRKQSQSGKDKVLYIFHAFVAVVGVFVVIGGTYGAAVSLKNAYADGTISKVFDCADNSGTIS
ncbi:transmembrane amino acid transporter protein-domain-containing protein [Xylariales sp. PMI_506]|nr:transmembrane amino acid transporter protein-domain-containing protein [Xylariales sp. PMI_506]